MPQYLHPLEQDNLLLALFPPRVSSILIRSSRRVVSDEIEAVLNDVLGHADTHISKADNPHSSHHISFLVNPCFALQQALTTRGVFVERKLSPRFPRSAWIADNTWKLIQSNNRFLIHPLTSYTIPKSTTTHD